MREFDEKGATAQLAAIRPYLLIGLAVTCVLLGALRASGTQSIDLEVLWFFVAAGVLLMLDKIKEFTIGKEGVSAKLEQLEEKTNAVENLALNLANAKPTATEPTFPVKEKIPGWDIDNPPLPQPTEKEDPQKGRFKGKSVNNGRRLSADVDQSAISDRYFDISLRVESVDESNPLTGSVIFYLHDTFLPPVRVVQVQSGIAELKLLAYGAFTVGAVADDGSTLLELDLAADPRFPKRFRES